MLLVLLGVPEKRAGRLGGAGPKQRLCCCTAEQRAEGKVLECANGYEIDDCAHFVGLGLLAINDILGAHAAYKILIETHRIDGK